MMDVLGRVEPAAVSRREILVNPVALFDAPLRLVEHPLRRVRMRLRQCLETHFVVTILLQWNAWTWRVQTERIHAPSAHRRIEAEKRPVPGRHRTRGLLHAVTHVDTVRDTLRVRQ